MEVTVSFYLVIIALALIGLISKNSTSLFVNLLTFSCVLEANFITSSSARIGGFDINMIEVVLPFLFLSSINVIATKRRINKKLTYLVILFLGVCFISILINLAIPYDKPIVPNNQSWDQYYYGNVQKECPVIGLKNWMLLAKLTIFCIATLAAAIVLNREHVLKITSIVLLSFHMHLIYVLFEFVSKTFFMSDITILIRDAILPSFDSAVSYIKIRGGLASLNGLTREPSHLSSALYIHLLLGIIVSRLKGRQDAFRHVLPWCLLSLVVMLLSASFSSLGYLAILAVLFVCERIYRNANNTKSKSIDIRIPVLVGAFAALLGLALCLCLTQFSFDNYYLWKLQNILTNALNLVTQNYSELKGSPEGIPRFISIIDSFYVFLDRPILGIGIGTIGPYSAMLALLSGTGLVGFVLWFAIQKQYLSVFTKQNCFGFLMLSIMGLGLLFQTYGMLYATYWILIPALIGVVQERNEVC